MLVPVAIETPDAPTNAAVESTTLFESRDALMVSPALVNVTEGKMIPQVSNLHNHTYTVNSCVAAASCKVVKPQEAVKKISATGTRATREQPPRRLRTSSIPWYPILETCADDPNKLKKIKRRIYDELNALRCKVQLNPVKTDGQRKVFLSKFNWNESLLNEDEKIRVEQHLFVKNLSVSARHLDIGANTEYKIKLKPQHEKPVFLQSLSTPTKLKDDFLVEFVLMQECRVIATLPFRKY